MANTLRKHLTKKKKNKSRYKVNSRYKGGMMAAMRDAMRSSMSRSAIKPTTKPNSGLNKNGNIPTDAIIVGKGSTKKVISLPKNSNHVYITPVNGTPFTPDLKNKMKQDYLFSKKLYEFCKGNFFPSVSEAWETPNTFIYKKQRCEQITDDITEEILVGIIQAAIDLIDQYKLFTLDLKPDNMGMLNGKYVFIDFGPECSYKLKDECVQEVINYYKSLTILILLIYCYNDKYYTNKNHRLLLKRLADHYIYNFIYSNKYMKDFKPDPIQDYSWETDPNIDYGFNKEVAPSYKYDSPYKCIMQRSVVINSAGEYVSNYRNTIDYFFPPLRNEEF